MTNDFLQKKRYLAIITLLLIVYHNSIPQDRIASRIVENGVSEERVYHSHAYSQNLITYVYNYQQES